MSNNRVNKHSFSYIPTQQDVDAYLKFKSGNTKNKLPQKPFMKDYRALHHIVGLSDTSILVYEAIRNLVGLYHAQLKFKAIYAKSVNNVGAKPILKDSSSVGSVRFNMDSIVGSSMIITNSMLQEWIGNKSHNTIKASLEQLESMGFIKCSNPSAKKNGRKITLLRDMEEYQPEEIKAIEAYLNDLNDANSNPNSFDNSYDNSCCDVTASNICLDDFDMSDSDDSDDAVMKNIIKNKNKNNKNSKDSKNIKDKDKDKGCENKNNNKDCENNKIRGNNITVLLDAHDDLDDDFDF